MSSFDELGENNLQITWWRIIKIVIMTVDTLLAVPSFVNNVQYYQLLTINTDCLYKLLKAITIP